ncbi:MAG: hypothetical protein J0L92_02005 [Deltaproteobacteria bacterium]|nr:hypothetical protein [Deltaproteobacteria bacterium]
MAIGWMWAAVGAAVVAWLVERQNQADVVAADRGETVALERAVDASVAFAVCALFLIAAPFVLAKARGARGFLEGLGILFGAWVGCTATIVGLALLRGY